MASKKTPSPPLALATEQKKPAESAPPLNVILGRLPAKAVMLINERTSAPLTMSSKGKGFDLSALDPSTIAQVHKLCVNMK